MDRRYLSFLVRQVVRNASVVGLAGLGLAAANLSACGGGADSPPPRPTPTADAKLGGSAPNAIHVFAKRAGGARQRLDFGQGTELSFGGLATDTNAPSSLLSLGRLARDPHEASGIRLLDWDGDGGTPVVPVPTVDAPGNLLSATAWVLVERASIQCGAEMEGGSAPWQKIGLASVGTPREANWFVYWVSGQRLPPVCSFRIALEQNLVCMADKLAEIADAVGTVTWPVVPITMCEEANGSPIPLPPHVYGQDAGPVDDEGHNGACDMYSEWEIPPQADKDRFVARDLAIHTLGMIPTVDSFTDVEGGETCSATFAKVAAGTMAVDNDATSSAIFGVSLTSLQSDGEKRQNYPVFPPSDVPIQDASGHSNAPAIARSALEIEAQILRGGGRLLRDLVRRDVYSDLASAAQQSAHAASNLGSRVAWGEAEGGRYGTIAHAARVLLGRWEIGDTADFGAVAQPTCEGVAAIDLVHGAFGGDLSARVDDLPLRTPGEALAAQLVERAGIVIPTCKLAAAAPGVLRSALIDQLDLQAQIQNGSGTTSSRRNVFERVVAPLSDPEILAAFERTLHTYRLLTNTADIVDTTEWGCRPFALGIAGLASVPDAQVIGSIRDLNGVVVKGGISRARLTTDPMARAGGMLEASQCNEQDPNSAWTEWGQPKAGGHNPAEYPYSLPLVGFQDAFHMGQAYGRRLALLRDAAGALTASPASDPESIARGAIAELQSWAGNTIVHAQLEFASAGAAQAGHPYSLAVELAGMPYQDLGLAVGLPPDVRQQAIANAFGFVYGPPWVAECAAHARADCPDDFDATYVQHPASVSDWTDAPTLLTYMVSEIGQGGNLFALVVPVDPTDGARVANFNPELRPATPGASHLYMVRLHDRNEPTGRGHVMGTIPLRYTQTSSGGDITRTPVLNAITSFVDAPMQRELVHSTIDLGRWVGARPPRLGDPSASEPSGYCVDGVPRDLFVPLDNELTSSSTSYEASWQHYLDLAKQAAQRADDLGQQLINQDFQITSNEQAAGEKLADLCGDFGMLSGVKVQTDGTTTASGDDPSTSICLDEPMTDIVFVGDFPMDPNGKPVNRNDTKAVHSFLHTLLKCDNGAPWNTDPLCGKKCAQANGLDCLKGDALQIAKTESGKDVGTSGGGVCDHLPGVQASLWTSFQGTGLRTLLGDPLFSAGGIQALAGSLRMNVNLRNDWSVSYGGQPIMSSTDTHLWPKCLDAGDACASLNVSTDPKAKSEAYLLAKSLNDTFRWCLGNDENARAVKLGCDGLASGAPPGVTAADAELNILKWRVMQALWMIAASAGTLPDSMFTLPVPVVTFPANTDKYPAATIYNGYLKEDGACEGTNPCLKHWSLDTLAGGEGTYSGPSSGDASLLGTVVDIAPAFSALTLHADQEMPTWYRTVYAPDSPAKHKYTGSSPLPFVQCKYRPDSANCTDPTPFPVTFASLLDDHMRTADGLLCLLPWADPIVGGTPVDTKGTDSEPWWLEVGYFKEGIQGRRDAWGSPLDWPGLDSSTLPYNWDYGVAQSGDPWKMSATALGPWERVPVFVGGGTSPHGTCGALTSIMQAATIACSSLKGSVANLSPTTPPAITSPDDIIELEGWLDITRKIVLGSVGKLYAESIPTRVVNDFRNGEVGTGDKRGAKGAAILDLEQALQSLPSAWVQMGTDLGEIRGAIETARLAITAANLQDQTTIGGIALQQIQVEGQMAQAIVGFMTAVVKAGEGSASTFGASTAEIPIAAIGLAQSLYTGNQELNQLGKLAALADQTKGNQTAQALAQLGQTTGPLWANVQTSLDTMRADVAKILADAQQIQLIQGQAKFQAAIGTGQDFASVAGQEVPIPVNTVLRRQASATEKRYQAALVNAKALTYMARRAIEQRIGVPLDAITTQVGPLEAPASWADDICALSGVNYKQLSTAVPAGADGGGIGGAVDQAAIGAFADAWVGDYVAKLQDFVAYYNAQYPSHQGTDTAVLSLRSDLLDAVLQCSEPAPNLLLNSGRLDAVDAIDASRPGWELHPCPAGSSTCLSLLNGGVLADPLDGPGGARAVKPAPDGSVPIDIGSGITWLSDVPATQGTGGTTPMPRDGWPGNLVSQAVTLDAGTYVLSWWDQARDTLGKLPDASAPSPASYVVRVYDASWAAVGTYYDAPYVPGPASPGTTPSFWSPRHALSFTVSQSATYRIAFGASINGSKAGSVAIANVQLEAASATDQPTTYIQTGETRYVTAYNCSRSESDLRAAFQHNCDSNGVCSYDLNVPMLIDTEALNAGDSALGGKLAKGNFNFRHGTLAVNLVGTGVHDCTSNPTPNCFGTGYIEYTLEHDATNAGILDYSGNARIFDFGRARVEHGKALAAERYLTMPLSSNDQSLISQPGIEHQELSGRPLDGAYRLRIWDSPALQWRRLQDIQIVVNYEYWSQIVANGNTGN